MKSDSTAEVQDVLQNPLIAFRSFVEIVRQAPQFFAVDPDLLFAHVQPFLSNPSRDEAYVKEIVEAYGVAWAVRSINKAAPLGLMLRILGKNKTIGAVSPAFISRLEALAAAMHSDLKPGSISLNVRPAQFIGVAEGYGAQKPRRYRIQVQTLVETPGRFPRGIRPGNHCLWRGKKLRYR